MKFLGKLRKTNAGLTASTFTGGQYLDDEILITRNIPEFLDTLATLYPDDVRTWLTRLEARKIYPRKQDVVHIEAPKPDKVWDFPSRHPGRPDSKPHHVTLINGQYNCTCQAADYGKVCWAIGRAQGG